MSYDLGANALTITMHDSPGEAPKYEKPEHLFAKVAVARVVGRGTVEGNPTVDLVFEDERGQKYVAMLTGGLIENLAGAVRGMRQRTAEQDSSRSSH
jgi:hypothetical protein